MAENFPTNKSKEVAYSTYDVYLNSGIYYQRCQAFAENKEGNYLYYPFNKSFFGELILLLISLEWTLGS